MILAKRPETRSDTQHNAKYREGSRGLGQICELCKSYDKRLCSIHQKNVTPNYKCDLGDFRESKRTGRPKK